MQNLEKIKSAEKPHSQYLNATPVAEEFKVVTRKKWIARKCLSRRNRHKSESDYLNDCPDVDVDRFETRLKRLCSEMIKSDYFILAMEALQQQMDILNLQHPLERVVCLGLGPFTRTHQAMHQAAFVMSLQSHTNVKEVYYYDPVFRDTEKELIERFKGIVIPENSASKDEAKVVTLYYLPHCPYALMNNLLWSNWHREKLQNVLLICNSFEMLTLNQRVSRDDHINRITKHCLETQLEDDYEHQNVFNDLSLHIFPTVRLPLETDTKFWTRCPLLKVNEDEISEELNVVSLND
ncbi:uncharacterized protein Dwil_GK11843 [Drosophila willistoni]|uniref:SRR1-like domain-containing protein n=1 Tax=Drosophila willistoni TaxID=7260 RepID=B4NB77_DROWI|nr:SRR1-like protein [Drosophila willistoni]EDW81041.1 uncharacterized protein Dwil_GK11843 [Drosophila willistoni]